MAQPAGARNRARPISHSDVLGALPFPFGNPRGSARRPGSTHRQGGCAIGQDADATTACEAKRLRGIALQASITINVIVAKVEARNPANRVAIPIASGTAFAFTTSIVSLRKSKLAIQRRAAPLVPIEPR